jgi:hypothetical protein
VFWHVIQGFTSLLVTMTASNVLQIIIVLVGQLDALTAQLLSSAHAFLLLEPLLWKDVGQTALASKDLGPFGPSVCFIGALGGVSNSKRHMH